MLRRLKLLNVGPSPQLEIEFADRLNVFTGDNGLGKTFLLDAAWWALTGSWPDRPALGERRPGGRTLISWTRRRSEGEEYSEHCEIPEGQPLDDWPRWALGPPGRGLALYARVDGGFSIWDGDRNVWPWPIMGKSGRLLKPAIEGNESLQAYHFSPQAVWDGLPIDSPQKVCLGLIHDWVFWQRDLDNPTFATFSRVLDGLSPEPSERLVPGDRPISLSIADARPIPTLRLPYGMVPITHASAAMKRILALSYLLVWAWTAHKEAARLRGLRPLDRIMLFVDEVEAHLHPRWQRVILPSVLAVAEQLAPDLSVQALVTTHSPLVLASLETRFIPDSDRLFVFRSTSGAVSLEEQPWAKQGDVSNWLVSETFELSQARSREAERAIEAAQAFLRGDATPDDLRSQDQIDAELRRVLAGHDPFWPRWLTREAQGKS